MWNMTDNSHLHMDLKYNNEISSLKVRFTIWKLDKIFEYIKVLGDKNTLLFTASQRFALNRRYKPSKLALSNFIRIARQSWSIFGRDVTGPRNGISTYSSRHVRWFLHTLDRPLMKYAVWEFWTKMNKIKTINGKKYECKFFVVTIFLL